MSALNTFDEEIQERKRKELSVLNSLLEEKKTKTLEIKTSKISDIKEKYENDAENKSQREFARITESARLEAKKILFDKINLNMNSAFEIIKRELKNYTKKAEYKKSLEKMVQFAKAQFGDDVVICCRDTDIPLLKDMNVTVGPQINTMGGITATDKGGRRGLDLTFEELLENNEDELKNFLYEKMVR